MKAVNSYLLCEVGHVPLLQELSARVLRRALEGGSYVVISCIYILSLF